MLLATSLLGNNLVYVPLLVLRHNQELLLVYGLGEDSEERDISCDEIQTAIHFGQSQDFIEGEVATHLRHYLNVAAFYF